MRNQSIALRRPLAGVFSVLLCAVLFSSWLTARQTDRNRFTEQQHTNDQVRRLAAELPLKVKGHEQGVRAARGALLVGGLTYTRSRDFDGEFPGASGFGFIRRTPVAKQDERDAVVLVQPSVRHLQAWGFDAAVAAMRTGSATLTPPIASRQPDGSSRCDLLLLLPAYKPDMPTDSVSGRESATFGWVYAALHADEVLNQPNWNPQFFRIQVRDITDDALLPPFISSGALDRLLRPDLIKQQTVMVYGRKWTITLQPTAQYLAALNLHSPQQVFWWGMLGSLLTSALVTALWILARMERKHLKVDTQLQSAQRDLASILDALPWMIGYWDGNLSNRIANRAFCTWFNVDQTTLSGTSMQAVLGAEAFELIRSHVDTALRGQRVTFERTFPGRDGAHSAHVVVQFVPNIVEGHVLGFYSLGHDITERKQFELKLTASEMRYRLLVEDQSELISLAGTDGKLCFVNQAYAKHFGLEATQIVGTNMYDYLPPIEHQAVREHLHAVCGSAQPISHEHRMLSAGGEHRWIAWTDRAITDDAGRVTGIHSVGRDITERKLVAAELQSSNERFAIASAAAGLGFWEFDVHANSLEWDEPMYRLFGRSPLKGGQPYALWADSLHPDDRARSEQEVSEALQGSRTFDTQFRIIHPDGSIKVIKAAGRVTRDQNGAPLRMFGVNVDVTEITESKNTLAAALRDTQGLLSTLHQHALVSVADRQGRITDVNAAFCAISGYTRDELLGKDHRIVSSRTHSGDFWRQLWRSLARGRPWRGEICNRAKDGSLYWVDSIIAPFLGADGRVEKYVSIRFDITTSKETERRLIDSEMFLERVEQVSGFGGFSIEFASNKQQWTRQTYRIHDVEEGNSPTLELVDTFFSPEVRARLQEAFDAAREKGIGYDLEVPMVTAKNRAIWVRVAGEVERDHGQLMRVVGAVQDITERRRAEIALRDSEQRLQMVTDNIPGLISHLDRDLRFLFVNKAYATWFDVDPGALIGMSLRHFYGEKIFAGIAGPLQSALNGTTVTDEREIVVGGNTRFCHVTLIPQWDDRGAVIGLFAIHTDITERRRAEVALRDSENFLARVGAIAGIGGWQMDLGDNTLTWSDETKRLHDVDLDYRPVLEEALSLYTPESRPAIKQAVKDGITHGRPWDLELELISFKGRRFWARATGAVEHRDGKAVRLVGAFQDISRERVMAEQLRRAKDHADKANRAKSEFLANMSHEIRTPLNAVIGLGYLLEQTSLSDDQHQFLSKIQFAGRSLLSVVNNVLDLSKIEAGEMALEDEPFDLPRMIHDVSDMLSPQATAKGIELITQTATTPRMVKGDLTRLRQVLANLLSNSIKFTQAGSVTLEVSCAERSADLIRLRCTITDTGIGIAQEALERLFTPFTQADASTTRRFGGTGLGLSIARRFVELMGGEIGVDSTVAVGSTFWIEVPLRVEHNADSGNATDHSRALHIVILDENGSGPDGFAAMVRGLGWKPELAQSDEQLLAAIASPQAGASPDVIILNLRTRDTDAGALIARLSQEWSVGELPPIIVVVDLVESYLAHSSSMRSADALLVWPVSSSALFNAINSAVWKQHDGRERLLQTTIFDAQQTQWLAGVRVLAVDDSDINLEVARRILEKQGAIVTCCLDGEAAVEHVRAHHPQLDIVLMDVQMPILDGNSAASRIRQELNLRELPIIALTAGALVGERQRCLSSGMNDFISKPFDPPVLIRKVRQLVEQARGQPVAMVDLGGSAAGDRAGNPRMSSIDFRVVQRMLGEDRALFKSLLGRLLLEYADFGLPCAPLPEDEVYRIDLQRRAHKLKGSAGMIGAAGVAQLAGAVEAALQKNLPVERLLQQLAAALTILGEEAQLISTGSLVKQVDLGPMPKPCNACIADIEDLFVLLQNHNLAAIDKYHVLASSLRDILGEVRFGRLHLAVENLDFPLGAETLREVLVIEGVTGSAAAVG